MTKVSIAAVVPKISISSIGYVCRFWKNYAVDGSVLDGSFPDETLEDAANYCRSPDNDKDGPWCYLFVEGAIWEHCDVPQCNGNETIILYTD